VNHHSDFLIKISIADVWKALGGGEIRHKRSRGFWRNGDGWNISIDQTKNCWYDFAASQGGGILDLIQVSLGCDSARAVEWARDFAGVPRRDLPAGEKRDYARRRAAAEREAEQLVEWRECIAEMLREWHDLNLSLYHCAKWLIVNGAYTTAAELDELIEQAEQAEREWERAEGAVVQWRAASWDDLVVLFRRLRAA
jgi:hypothetical protein